jgi:hypothetical protein
VGSWWVRACLGTTGRHVVGYVVDVYIPKSGLIVWCHGASHGATVLSLVHLRDDRSVTGFFLTQLFLAQENINKQSFLVPGTLCYLLCTTCKVMYRYQLCTSIEYSEYLYREGVPFVQVVLYVLRLEHICIEYGGEIKARIKSKSKHTGGPSSHGFQTRAPQGIQEYFVAATLRD